jgi:hypothetical protein
VRVSLGCRYGAAVNRRAVRVSGGDTEAHAPTRTGGARLYVVDVAFATGAQLPPLLSQRSQAYAYVIVPPVQAPRSSVSVFPSSAVPETLGSVVFRGAACDRACASPPDHPCSLRTKPSTRRHLLPARPTLWLALAALLALAAVVSVTGRARDGRVLRGDRGAGGTDHRCRVRRCGRSCRRRGDDRRRAEEKTVR